MKATLLFKVKFNISVPTIPKPNRLPATSGPSKNPSKLNAWQCTKVQTTLLLPTPSLISVVALTATCTRPLTSKAKEGIGLKSLFMIMLFMLGAKTMAKYAIGVVGPDTTSKNVIALDIAVTAHVAAMTELTASTLMTFAMKKKIARSTPLTLISSAGTAPLLTTTLTSKGR